MFCEHRLFVFSGHCVFFFLPSLSLLTRMASRSHKPSSSTSGMLSVRPLDPKKLEPFKNGAAPPPPYVVRSKRPSDSSTVVVTALKPTQSTPQKKSQPAAEPAAKTAAEPVAKPTVVVGTPPAKVLSPLSKPPSPPKTPSSTAGTTAQSQAQTLLNGHYVCKILHHQMRFRCDIEMPRMNRKSWSRWEQAQMVWLCVLSTPTLEVSLQSSPSRPFVHQHAHRNALMNLTHPVTPTMNRARNYLPVRLRASVFVSHKNSHAPSMEMTMMG